MLTSAPDFNLLLSDARAEGVSELVRGQQHDSGMVSDLAFGEEWEDNQSYRFTYTRAYQPKFNFYNLILKLILFFFIIKKSHSKDTSIKV